MRLVCAFALRFCADIQTQAYARTHATWHTYEYSDVNGATSPSNATWYDFEPLVSNVKVYASQSPLVCAKAGFFHALSSLASSQLSDFMLNTMKMKINKTAKKMFGFACLCCAERTNNNERERRPSMCACISKTIMRVDANSRIPRL